MSPVSFSKARNLALSLLPFKRPARLDPGDLPGIAVPAEAVEVLLGPEAFRQRLLELIVGARTRILLSTLYLQDDDGGREILTALYAAKASHPDLHVAVLVDWHRAQRGLIGKGRSAGNAAMYREMALRFGPGIPIHGIPVQTRELMGVMHLKGFVLDDVVLYSGASLNDVYLQRHARYRLDRYHLVKSPPLADSLAQLLSQVILADPAAHVLDGRPSPSRVRLRNEILRFRRRLKRAAYMFTPGYAPAPALRITPLLGLGRSGNALNATILQLVQRAQKRLVLFTPYFNLPRPLQKAIRERLRAGCHVTIILGDKTANDFYLPPGEPFKAIGVLPYLYESNLRRFCRTQQKAIDRGLLDVHLWRDGDNTFHLKGVMADEAWTLLTGNNLNPRAWWLDLENGLLISDPHRLLAPQHAQELDAILRHARRLAHHRELETVDQYPLPVQRLLKRLTRPRLDRLINRVL